MNLQLIEELKFLNKFVLSFLSLCLILSLILVPANAESSNKVLTNPVKSNTVRITYNNDSNNSLSAERIQNNYVTQETVDQYDEIHDSNQINSISPLNVGSIDISFQMFPIADSSKITIQYRVEDITGDEPDKVVMQTGIYGRVTRDGSANYPPEGNGKTITLFNPSEGDTHSVDFPISSTKYFIFYADINLYEDNVFVGTGSAALSKVLLNKKAVVYPSHVDPYSGTVMIQPERTDWSKTTPISWDRTTYVTWYNQTYPNHLWNWNQTQVHHIRPRAYGGTNSYSNLVPIQTNYHYIVSAWWTNY